MTNAANRNTPQLETGAPGKVRVWDPVVRLFHWSLVAAFALAWLTGDGSQRTVRLTTTLNN